MAKNIILDTDIGGDIDDTWALGLALASSELNIKLALSCVGNTVYRAKIIAKFFEQTGHTDIPVGIGIKESDEILDQGEWVKDYNLSSYPGTVYEDGVRAMVDMIMSSEERITLVTLGPLTNIAAALKMEPRIAEKCDIIAIMGSIYHGHSLDAIKKDSDYNVRVDIPAARRVLSAPWDIAVVPLDVTAHLVIGDDNYQKLLSVRDSNAVVGAIMENFDCWKEARGATYYKTHSTALYDLAGVYMASMGDYNLITEDHKLVIDDGGFTNDDENGKLCHCAVYWKYVDMFYHYVTKRLCGEA